MGRGKEEGSVGSQIFIKYKSNPLGMSHQKIMFGMLLFFLLSVVLTACGSKQITLPEQPPYKPELQTSCCQECVEAFSQSPVAVGEEGAVCGQFTTGKPLSASCEDYFEVNYMSAGSCQEFVRS